jgi:ribosomal 50S subunit-recycling heat shock protein
MSTEEKARIDVWLWRARFFKTRSQAAEFVGAGRVRLIRSGGVKRLDKPSAPIAPGDVVSFVRDGRIIVVTVRALGARRGPPAEARLLYEETPQQQPVDEIGRGGHLAVVNPDGTP